MATIEIFITDQGAAAQSNHDSEDRGQTVTWVFPEGLTAHQVVFKAFEPPGPLGSGTRQIISKQGPFSGQLLNIGGQVEGTIDANAGDGHYFYGIEDGEGRLLPWLNSLGPNHNFGGLDIPKGPPRPAPLPPTGGGD